MAQKEIDITKSATQLQNDINSNFGELYRGAGGDVVLSRPAMQDGGYYLICEYDVNDTSAATSLIHSTSQVTAMEVDGVSQTLATSFTFSTTGRHVVKFTWKDGETTLAAGTFQYYGDAAPRLRRVWLPSAVTAVANNAFYFNVHIDAIIYGANITSLGTYNSSGSSTNSMWTYISHVVLTGSTPFTFSGFKDKGGDAATVPYIHVPKGSAAAYKAHESWSAYASMITEDPIYSTEQLSAYDANGLGIAVHPLVGKKFAFLGDSFTSHRGYSGKSNPTWAEVMCERLGARYMRNVASGSQGWVTGDSNSVVQAHSLVTSGETPDYILAFMGVNDRSSTLGSITYSSGRYTAFTSAESSEKTFTLGVQACIEHLMENFPNSIIKIGWTPSGSQYTGSDDVSQFVDRLKELAVLYGVEYIETRYCQISPYVYSTSDGYWQGGGGGYHPTAKGFVRIGEFMARTMLCHL